MTNIKAKGFDSAAQWREHLLELEDDRQPGGSAQRSGRHSVETEVAMLRQQVSELRERLSLIRGQTEDVGVPVNANPHPWLRIATTVVTTFVLGRLVQRLRLGAAGAVAVPLIAAQLDSRFPRFIR